MSQRFQNAVAMPVPMWVNAAMTEKVLRKKAVALNITKSRLALPKLVLPKAFSIREDSANPEYIDVLFEPLEKGARVERIRFDGLFMVMKPDNTSTYLASLDQDPSDSFCDEKIDAAYSAEPLFSNFLLLGRLADRAETIFSLVSIYDWGSVSKEAKPGETKSIEAVPILVVYSGLAFQKKLVSDIFTQLKVAI